MPVGYRKRPPVVVEFKINLLTFESCIEEKYLQNIMYASPVDDVVMNVASVPTRFVVGDATYLGLECLSRLGLDLKINFANYCVSHEQGFYSRDRVAEMLAKRQLMIAHSKDT